MLASLTILLDVAVFRLRKLEMANLAAALVLSLVLRLPPHETALRLLAAGVLNLLVYLNNDYLDVAADLQAADRDASRTRFLHAHLGTARTLQWLLAAALVALGALIGPGLILTLLAGGGICIAYSAKLKHVPYADIAAMAAWGVAMPLVGAPVDSRLGWLMALQLGCFSAVFESLQVLRDREKDSRAGVRTSAVLFGGARTVVIARGLMLVCAGFGAACLHPVFGGGLALALLLPLSEANAARDWTRVKAVYGLCWLACCAWLFSEGQAAGLLVGAARGMSFDALAAPLGGP